MGFDCKKSGPLEAKLEGDDREQMSIIRPKLREVKTDNRGRNTTIVGIESSQYNWRRLNRGTTIEVQRS